MILTTCSGSVYVLMAATQTALSFSRLGSGSVYVLMPAVLVATCIIVLAHSVCSSCCAFWCLLDLLSCGEAEVHVHVCGLEVGLPCWAHVAKDVGGGAEAQRRQVPASGLATWFHAQCRFTRPAGSTLYVPLLGGRAASGCSHVLV